MIELKGKYTTAKVMVDLVEDSCIEQIKTFINSPHFTEHVAIMPDTHAGKGSVIGFTMPITKSLIPNVIGVDIGCGVVSAKIGPKLPLSLEDLDSEIRLRIPFGMNTHKAPVIDFEKQFPWDLATNVAYCFSSSYYQKLRVYIEPPKYTPEWFEGLISRIGGDPSRYINSIGTLGGGNHFIETGIDDNGEYWVTVHSGSRNLGKMVCEYWQRVACGKVSSELKEKHRIEKNLAFAVGDKGTIMKVLKGHEKELNISKDLSALSAEDTAGYLFDMLFAQVYASFNRETMINIIEDTLGLKSLHTIESIHNYIDLQDLVIRKGAIRSYVGEEMVIPFNMRDGILICEGKSNPEWNCSAPHGAGRVLSRSEAFRKLNLDTFKSQMEGIYSTSVTENTLDEAPDSYKPADIIEAAIEPTAKILLRIKPIHNMKDSSGPATYSKKRKTDA